MDAAREIKDKGSGSSIMELSIVDVSIGKVRILSLSPDSSTLAASVGRDVHFFFVDALLSKVMRASSGKRCLCASEMPFGALGPPFNTKVKLNYILHGEIDSL